MTSTITREFIKALIAEGAIAIIVAYAFMDAFKVRAGRRVLAGVLGVAAILSVFAYFEFGQKRYDRYMNPHDVYHYYLGSKYAPELRYTGLYEATAVADYELRPAQLPSDGRIRDLETHGYVSIRDTLRRREEIKESFSPSRWEAFKGDVLYFRSVVPKRKWASMVQDKGYNGTPVWGTFAAAFSSMASTSSNSAMFFLALLDPILIAVMFGFVLWAFGWRAMLIAVVFFGTNFTMSFVHAKGGFLRLDWLAAAIISMCLVKKGWFKTGGGVFAYAAASRIFPVIFLVGLGAIGLWHLLSKRQIHRQIAGFFIVFALVSAAMVGASAAVFGTDYWNDFSEKIAQHNDDISTTRVGFKYFFVRSADTSAEKNTLFAEQQGTWYAIQAAVLLLTILGAARLKPYEAMGLGFVPVFFLTAPTFYYYMMLSIPLLVFLPDFSTWRRALGLSLFFAFSVGGYVLHRFHDLAFDLSFYLSSMLLCICAYMIAWSMPAVPVPQAATGKLRRAWGYPASIAAGVLIGIATAAFIFYSVDRGETAPAEATADAAATQEAAPEQAQTIVRPVELPVAHVPEGVARLVFGGDVMLSRNVARSIRENNRDWTYPFAMIAPFVRDSEIAFCNLESPISGRGTAIEKRYLFNAPPESVQGLAHARFDVVSLANNHILDYGLEAMDDTVRNVTQAGLRPLGLTTGNEPQTPVVIERNGVRVGFLGYVDPKSPYGDAKEFAQFDRGPAKATLENVKRDIEALRASCDVLVVSVHWGVEYETAPGERQRELGRYAIDQGAEIVVGHHTHVQQPIERYGEGVIFYSLGNLVFDQWSRPPTREARLVRVTVNSDGAVHAIEELPAIIARNVWQPRPEANAYRAWSGTTVAAEGF